MEKIIKLTEKYERNGWPAVARPDIKPPQGWSISLITSLERIRNHSLSPDGSTLAYIKDGESLSDVFLLAREAGWPRRITTERGLVAYWDDEIPQWSPDSRWIAFTMNKHVHVVPAEGGLPRKITDFTSAAFSPKWMPDSKGLIVGVERDEADQLVLTDRDGTWPRALTIDAEGDHWDPQPAPDGRSVAFVYRCFDDLNRLEIRVVDVESGKITTVRGRARTRMEMPRWSPDGQRLAFISQEAGHDDLWMARPDGTEPRQVTNLGHDISNLAWSPDGRWVAATVNRDASLELVLIDPSTGEVVDLRGTPGVHSRPNWGPDGKTLTFEFESPILPPDIYELDLATKGVKQLTFSEPPALAANRLVMPKRVSYRSFDGLEIPALLFVPERPNGAAVLYPHGGPRDLYAFEYDILAQYLVARGYTYLAINYRGSTGYGVEYEFLNHDDWGKGDTQDCLHGAKYLRTLDWIDPARIAILGGSYGGYMTICSLSRDPEYLFACGVAKYGDSNLVSSWAQCNRELRLYTEIFLGHPSRNREVYINGSPIAEARNVQRPVLILHGLLDDVVPPEASEEWVEALRREGKTFEYKTYDDEPHGFLRRENLTDVYERIERFLDWYLLPGL
ncbi:MAG: LpqB family beta-propeller domain-containing protein [Bacteroidota bacterium]